jgi:hypothetical protein
MDGDAWMSFAVLPPIDAEARAAFHGRLQELVTGFGQAEGAMAALRVKAMGGASNAPVKPRDVMQLKHLEKMRDNAMVMLRAEAARFHGPLAASDGPVFKATLQRVLVMLATGISQKELGAMFDPPNRTAGDKAIGAALLALTWCFAELPHAMKILARGEEIRLSAVAG